MKKIVTVLIMFGVLALGAFCRYYGLQQEIMLDEDASIHSMYSEKYFDIFKMALSPDLRQLIKEKRQTARDLKTSEWIRQIAESQKFLQMFSSVRKTDVLFPDWSAKPAFVVFSALYRFFDSRPHSLLNFTALLGFLIIPVAGLIYYMIWKSSFGAIIVMLLVAISPMLSGFSRTGHSNIAAVFFLTLALLPYLKGLRSDKFYWLLAVGFLIGVAMLFHPMVLPWFAFLVLQELIFFRKEPSRIVYRIGHIFLGFLVVILFAEVLHAIASNISLLLVGEMIKPYLFSLLTHGVSPEKPEPLFYLKVLWLFEGIFFVGGIGVCCYFLKKKNVEIEEKACLALMFLPLILFSLLTSYLFPSAKIMLIILVPSYLLIGRVVEEFFFHRVDNKRIILFVSIVLLFHFGYALYSNWQNDAPDNGVAEFKNFIISSRVNPIFPDNVVQPVEVLIGCKLSNKPQRGMQNLYCYWGTDRYLNDPRVSMSFSMNYYDRKIYLLDDKQSASLWFNREKRRILNRIFCSASRLSL